MPLDTSTTSNSSRPSGGTRSTITYALRPPVKILRLARIGVAIRRSQGRGPRVGHRRGFGRLRGRVGANPGRSGERVYREHGFATGTPKDPSWAEQPTGG